jgi:hypothetical protein
MGGEKGEGRKEQGAGIVLLLLLVLVYALVRVDGMGGRRLGVEE